MKVAVVILNWNGKDLLEKFIPNILTNSPEAEVIVADNGSDDSSLAFLAEQFPHLRVIALDRNYGFAQGYNEALSQIEADYYVLLNSDVEVTPQWLKAPIALMESDLSIAVCQPKILCWRDKANFEYAGASGGYIDSLGYPFCRGRIFDTLERDHGQYDDPVSVSWATGAAMIVKASVYRELGGLDGDFFAHMEEIDFCWRVRHQGLKVMVVPASIVYHMGGATLSQGSPRKTYLNFRNNRMMLYKNLQRNQLFKVLSWRFFLDFLAALQFLISGRRAHASAIVKAYRDYYKSKSRLRAQRAALNPGDSAKSSYQGVILIDYHLRGRKTFNELNKNQFNS